MIGADLTKSIAGDHAARRSTVAIVGCGSLGSVFAALLARAGLRVVAVCRTREQCDVINRSGLLLLENGREERVAVAACGELPLSNPGSQFDLVLVLVKAYDTKSAVKELSGRLQPGVPVLTLQNGLGNAEILAGHLGGNPVLAGTTTFGAQRLSPGVVALTGRGECEIGAWNNGTDDCVTVAADLLSGAGIPTKVSSDVKRAIWNKLAISAVINPLTAILRVPNGGLLRSLENDRFREGIAEIAEEIVKEVRRAAQACGVVLPDSPALLKEVQRVCQITAGNRSSMLRDMEEHRRTEIDAINGAIVRLSKSGGVRSPANAALAGLIRALQR